MREESLKKAMKGMGLMLLPALALILLVNKGCSRSDIVGTPEYCEQITGVRYDPGDPLFSGGRWSGVPSEGASFFVFSCPQAVLKRFQQETLGAGFYPISSGAYEGYTQTPWQGRPFPPNLQRMFVAAKGHADGLEFVEAKDSDFEASMQVLRAAFENEDAYGAGLCEMKGESIQGGVLYLIDSRQGVLIVISWDD